MRNVPLLVIPIVVYNLVAPFGMDLSTRVVWVLSTEDILTTLALVFIGVELWRSAISSPRELTQQMANLALFVVAVLELALIGWCRSGTFFTLTLATLVTLVDANFVAFVTRGTNVLVSNR